MQLIFLVIQIILALAIIGCVLLQKNGGDGLGGLGGGSGVNGNSIVSGRATANFLSKSTTVLMLFFMVNSLILGNLAVRDHHKQSVVEQIKHESESPKASVPQAPISE